MGNSNASWWAPMDVSIGLAQCHDLQTSVVWTHIGLRAGPACPAVQELKSFVSHIRPPEVTPAVV